MDNLNTIVLKGKGHYDEGVVDAEVYPGEAVRMAADGNYDPEPLTTTAAEGKGLTIACENGLIGKTTADAYAADDVVFLYTPLPGDDVQVRVASGQDVNIGDYLAEVGSGAGTFKVISSATAQEYKLPLTSAKVHDAMATDLPAAVANDDMALITGTPGTDAPTLQGADPGGTTSLSLAAFEYILPVTYRAGGALTVRVKAGVLTTVADTALTLDVSCWKDAGTGLVGSDLCATAAQSINSLTAANKDFTITPTGLVAGDRLIIRLTIAGEDSGNLGAMVPEISNVAVLVADAISGKLEAREDSGGALAAAALIQCRVL